MRPENRGEQREIVTVRELYKSEREEYPPAVRYILISGERRWRSAGLAGLSDIEIRVKQYESVADEELDMYMLNEGRVALSDIENADYLARIMGNYNLKTQGELASKVGKEQTEVSQLLSLLKLSPKARERMSPKLPEYARLKRQVGVFLAHLEHSVQDDFLERMPRDRATASQQISWMQTELKEKAIVLPTKQASPADLRDIFGYFADQVSRRAGELLAKPNKRRLFQNVKEGQTEALVRRLEDAGARFSELLAEVKGFAGLGLAPRVAPESVLLPAKPVEPKPAPQADLKAEAARFLEKRAGSGKPGTVPPAQPANLLNGGAKRPLAPLPSVEYFDKGKELMRNEVVTRSQYLKLWDNGNLKFQIRKQPKPDNYPTYAQVKRELESIGL
jgi:ParB-like chromosome segregation protein Spo0J